jgi:hypothetical protein
MKHIATPEFITLFEKYPLYSQENNKDQLIIAKLFDTFGSATWYLTEYNPTDNIAFGYVTGLIQDEWGYLSIEELEGINHDQLGVPRIERDLYFTQAVFSEVIKPA